MMCFAKLGNADTKIQPSLVALATKEATGRITFVRSGNVWSTPSMALRKCRILFVFITIHLTTIVSDGEGTSQLRDI